MDDMEQAVRDAMGVDIPRPISQPVTRPYFEKEAQNHVPLMIMGGTYVGMVGLVQEIRTSQDGYTYGLSDLPDPARPNQIYWFPEAQLALAENGSKPGGSRFPNTTDYHTHIPTNKLHTRLNSVIEELSILEIIRQELAILREQMMQLTELMSRQLGKIRVEVTYQKEEPYESTGNPAAASSTDSEPVSIPINRGPQPTTRRGPRRKPKAEATTGTGPGVCGDIPQHHQATPAPELGQE